MRRVSALVVLSLLLGIAARAQDERRVASPDGRIEFRIFLTHPEPEALVRLAYQVYYRGQRAINTSFLGLDIHDQPILGENVGLISSQTNSSDRFHTLIAEYMQNGSLGRRINVEVRAFNDGVAFRYLVPKSGPLERMFLQDEATEFEFVQDAEVYPGHVTISHIARNKMMGLPFVAEEPGIGWISISEARAGNYPPMSLGRADGKILIARLPPRPGKPEGAWEGSTPLICPWRIVAIGPTRESVTESNLPNSLHP